MEGSMDHPLLVTFGEFLIDMFPSEHGREMAEVTSFKPKPGGAPANVAVAATRLGTPSAFIGKVGDDFFGHYLERVLEDENVNTRGLRFDADVRTTLAFIALPDVNRAEFVFYRNPGADLMIRPDEIDIKLFESAHAFHFGSLSLVEEPARSATMEGVRLAHEIGALVSYDVNYRPTLWMSSQEAISRTKEILPEVNLVKVNETELSLLTDSDEIESSCHELLNVGPELIVVTMGGKGSFFYTQNTNGYIPAFDVETVDATGCGDAFIAGLLHRLVHSMNWRSMLQKDRLSEILTYANAVGALTSMTLGVIPALPYAKQVDDFLVTRR